jgi:hypothetical protein
LNRAAGSDHNRSEGDGQLDDGIDRYFGIGRSILVGGLVPRV